MERSASDLYTACIVVEMISADCAIVPPGPLGASRVGDGYLWYLCGCRNGLICDHIKAGMVAFSVVCPEDWSANHDLRKYWKDGASRYKRPESTTEATRVEDCMTQRFFLSDIVGHCLTEAQVLAILSTGVSGCAVASERAASLAKQAMAHGRINRQRAAAVTRVASAFALHVTATQTTRRIQGKLEQQGRIEDHVRKMYERHGTLIMPSIPLSAEFKKWALDVAQSKS
eukprot:m.202681 g.202681  ORF g.202681 m.202681 type:complete len:229 (+) comp25249_c2_seq17:2-688(+)